MLQLTNISKSYKDQQVLDGVSVEFPGATFSTIIGPNGSGKSTLLNIAGRLLKPDAGEISLEGSELARWPRAELAKGLSILKQSNHTSLRITTEELVTFGRFPHNSGRVSQQDREAVAKALEYTELEAISHKYIGELSGGQLQRAYIAMTIAQDSKVILLDEPLNNLDLRHSIQVMNLLKRLCHEQGRAIVMVLHDINLASSYSDRIHLMKDGQFKFIGSPAEAMHDVLLTEVFQTPCRVINVKGKRACLYF